MAYDRAELPEWERLLVAERHVQALAPGAELVEGSAAARHARHRRSADGDHVLTDLRDRLAEVLAGLERAAGWRSERVLRPVLILGQLDGVLAGIRQLRRAVPLETEEVEGLRVPTLAEMARVKAWLLTTRHTMRDYLDLIVLLERLGARGASGAVAALDAMYPQPTGASVLAEVAERLAAAAPSDLPQIGLATYEGLVAPWDQWANVAARGRAWAPALARLALAEEPSS